MKFTPLHTDFVLSPYTGLTRESWISAAKYLLKGIFGNIPSPGHPVSVPRCETEITYPHKNAEGIQLEKEKMAQRFEGLARSLLIAAPLIHENPETEICGFNLRDYYSAQILRSCTKGDENYVGDFEYLCTLEGGGNIRTFQQTVETCALVIGLEVCRAEIWDRYTKKQRDIIAGFLSGYAHSFTVPQNWRLFNMLDMAFLHKSGYEINRNIMLEHAQAILGYYAGEGWYRDGHSFDYYSCWAFNVYTPIWNEWYGYENLPLIAEQFEKNTNELMKTYPDFFDRDGFVNMWGRSCIYRCAAAGPLSECFRLKNTSADPGLARRIASGALLQFLSREDFLVKGVPAIGFYGQFSPLVQGYSCAESVYWLGKAFLCLTLPKEHPFWTAKENNGSWEELREKEYKKTVLPSPGLCFTNHNANGTTILRTGKVVKNTGDLHGMHNYSKLCYSSKYPWEAYPGGNIESMQYVLTEGDGGSPKRCNVTLWHGEKEDVLYRRQFFDYSLSCESHWCYALNLADFPVEYGIIRADKLRLFCQPVTLTLGGFGFPDNGTEMTCREKDGAKAVILKGKDSQGREKQLAMTVYDGWQDIDIIKSRGTNPDSENSVIPYAVTKREILYGYEQFILVSQVITKESAEDFTDEEIFPVSRIEYSDTEGKGGYGDVLIRLKNGREIRVCFDRLEGCLTM